MRRSWLVILLLLGACTGPVRSFSVYESKAGATAESAASAVETARLATDAAAGDKVPGRYLTAVVPWCPLVHAPDMPQIGREGAG